jgi:alpha-L-fucosidase
VTVQAWPEINGKKIPWETCQTCSGSWGYYRDESTWKSTQQLLALLIESVSKGGNLLLNVGPTSRGTFDNRATGRLQEMGTWMKLHNRSIYGCTEAPAEFKAPQNCLLTYNPDRKRLYVHLLVWPMGTLHLEGYAGKVKYAQLLNDGSEVRIEKPTDEWAGTDKSTLTLSLPILKPDVAIPVIELFLD